MPKFDDLIKNKKVLNHPLLDGYRKYAQETWDGNPDELTDMFSSVNNQYGTPKAHKDLRTLVAEVSMMVQDTFSQFDLPQAPEVRFMSNKDTKYAKHDPSHIVSSRLDFDVTFRTLTGVKKHATITVGVVDGTPIPPSMMEVNNRVAVISQHVLSEMIGRSTSYALPPLREGYDTPLNVGEREVAVATRNDIGWQPNGTEYKNYMMRKNENHKISQVAYDASQETLSAVKDIIESNMAQLAPIFDDAQAAEYVSDLSMLVNSWIGDVANTVQWAEDSGTGDTTSLDYADIKGQIQKYLERMTLDLGIEFGLDLSDVEAEAIDAAYTAASQYPGEGFDDDEVNEGFGFAASAGVFDKLKSSPKRKQLDQGLYSADPEDWYENDQELEDDEEDLQNRGVYGQVSDEPVSFESEIQDRMSEIKEWASQNGYSFSNLEFSSQFEEASAMTDDPDVGIVIQRTDEGIDVALVTDGGDDVASTILQEGDDLLDLTAKTAGMAIPSAYVNVVALMEDAESDSTDIFPRSYDHILRNYILEVVSSASKDAWMIPLINDGFCLNPYGTNVRLRRASASSFKVLDRLKRAQEIEKEIEMETTDDLIDVSEEMNSQYYPDTKTPIEISDGVRFSGPNGNVRGTVVEIDDSNGYLIIKAKGMEYRVPTDAIEPLPSTFQKMYR